MRYILAMLALLWLPALLHAQGAAPLQLVNDNPTVYDLGTLGIDDQPQPFAIPLKNTGNSPLVITSAVSDTSSIICKWPSGSKPGKGTNLYVTYAPKDPTATGSFSSKVTVSVKGSSSVFCFTITGAVVPGHGTAPLQGAGGGHKSHSSRGAIRANTQ